MPENFKKINESQFNNLDWELQFITWLNSVITNIENNMFIGEDLSYLQLEHNATQVQKHSLIVKIREKFIEFHKNRNTISSGWNTKDIEDELNMINKLHKEKEFLYEYTEEDLIKIARFIESNFDTSLGITRELIRECIHAYFDNITIEI